MTLRIAQWSIDRIAPKVGGRVVGDGSFPPTEVSTDTRTIGQGALFLALEGERFDGHDYVAQAAEKGAAAAIVSHEVDAPLTQIVVGDTLVALQKLAKALFAEAQQTGVRSVALTGSNGKTTTKELLAAMWGTTGQVHATRGNLNNEIGVPLTLCAMPLEADMVIVEMGAGTFGDIRKLIEIAPADIRVITSIGHAHIERLGSLDGVRRAKSEIFDFYLVHTAAVVPRSEVLRLDFHRLPGPIVTVGEIGDGAVIEWETTPVAGGRQRVHIVHPGGEWTAELGLPGPHNAANLATAFATLIVGEEYFDPDEIAEAVRSVELPGGRWRRVERGPFTFVDDAYNANPSSVRASWSAFAEIVASNDEVDPGDVVGVLGEMLELGPDSADLHAETARWLVEQGDAGAWIFVGTHADAMAEAAAEVADIEVVAAPTPADAAEWLAKRAGGLVWLKASRGQKLERILEHFPQ